MSHIYRVISYILQAGSYWGQMCLYPNICSENGNPIPQSTAEFIPHQGGSGTSLGPKDESWELIVAFQNEQTML